MKRNETFLTPSSDTGLLLPASQYINFGQIYGASGYGIRDNAGTMQFKHNLGAWADLGSGGGGFADPLTTNGDIIARISGSTTRLAQGANGTFLGVSSGVLGYYTPAGGVTDGNKGDITASSGGTVWTINTNAVVNADLAQMATKTYKGRTTAGTGNAEDVPVATLKTDLVLVKGDVGLGNVDNTSDVNKPVSTAQQTALNLKEDVANKATSFATLNNTLYPSTLAVSTELGTRDTANRSRANHTGSQLASTISDFASSVLATVLSGISFATGTAVTASDTVLSALGKLQKQNTDQDTAINARVGSVTAGTNVTVTGTATAPIVNAPTMTATVGGAVPTPPNNTTTFLRGDGTFSAPSSGFADPLTTNGDLIARISGATTRLPQGGNGQFLGVSSGVLGYYTPAGGVTVETPTFVSGTSYTVTVIPKWIVMDGVIIFEGANGYSRASLTITLPYLPTNTDQFKSIS